MRYVARVTDVLHSGIHKIATSYDPLALEDLPLPNHVVIECDDDETNPCMMYRYTDDGRFCGDTWHENVADAFRAAAWEYGLSRQDWMLDS